MPVTITYIEVTTVTDQDGKQVSKTKVKLDAMPHYMTVSTQNGAPAAPRIPGPNGTRIVDMKGVARAEDLPDVPDKAGQLPLTKEERFAHIKRLEQVFGQTQTLLQASAMPMVESDAEIVRMFGVEPAFKSPVPEMVTGENGEVEARTVARGTGPQSVTGEELSPGVVSPPASLSGLTGGVGNATTGNDTSRGDEIAL